MKLLMLSVRGKSKNWSFSFYGDPQFLEEWRADGLEIFEVSNVVPAWIAECGLVRPWCFVQDIFNLRNPFK